MRTKEQIMKEFEEKFGNTLMKGHATPDYWYKDSDWYKDHKQFLSSALDELEGTIERQKKVLNIRQDRINSLLEQTKPLSEEEVFKELKQCASYYLDLGADTEETIKQQAKAICQAHKEGELYAKS